MKIQTRPLLFAASLFVFGTTACDDDGAPSGQDAAGLDGSTPFDGGITDAPAGDTIMGGDTAHGDAAAPDAAPINPACAPSDPNTYPAAMFAANTTAEQQLLGKLKTLNDAMTEAETTLTKTITRQQIDAQFSEGASNIKEATSAYYATQLEGQDGIFNQFVEASDNKTFVPGTSAGLATWVFNAKGLDLRQQFDKGLMSALQYRHMATISRQATVTAADIDRMLAIMGGEPAFPYDTTNDKSAAKYLSRRSDRANPNNLYLSVKRASLLAKASAAKPAECAAELAASLKTIREAWEKALAATTLYYAADARKKLMTATDDAAKAAALHGIGEGIAFVHGLKGLPATDRIITDAQVDNVVRDFGYLDAAAAVSVATLAPYKFVGEFPLLAKLDNVVNAIATVYGFSMAEVVSFKINQPTTP